MECVSGVRERVECVGGVRERGGVWGWCEGEEWSV